MGKGTHRAADQAQALLKRYRYALKADVAQFFPSIDHAVLEQLLARHIACQPTLDLCRKIIASGDGILASEYTLHLFPGDDLFAALRPRGLPIGNLTSQFWANVYLNPVDTLLQRELRLPHVRYCDDLLVFADNKATLHQAHAALEARMAALRLRLHPTKTRIHQCCEGIEFVATASLPIIAACGAAMCSGLCSACAASSAPTVPGTCRSGAYRLRFKAGLPMPGTPIPTVYAGGCSIAIRCMPRSANDERITHL